MPSCTYFIRNILLFGHTGTSAPKRGFMPLNKTYYIIKRKNWQAGFEKDSKRGAEKFQYQSIFVKKAIRYIFQFLL